MKVQLITVPKFVVSIDNKEPEMVNGEDLAIYIARVSSPKTDEEKLENTEKLLNYLIKNNHWSPFEHAYYTFKINTSRAIGAQLLRHRSFTFQEFSQRYSEVANIEDIEFRKKAAKNRQSSSKPIGKVDRNLETYFYPIPDGDESINRMNMMDTIAEYLKKGQELYQELLLNNVAKECARMILPLASETTIYMTGSLRSWIHFLQIRNDEHAQKEVREIAVEIQEILKENNPKLGKLLW